MRVEEIINQRSQGKCELCNSDKELQYYVVPPSDASNEDGTIRVCQKCLNQIEKKEELDSGHWRILGETMWSEVPGVQVVAWRMLNRLREESWASENLDMLYLEDDKLEWAKSTGDHENDSKVEIHKDAYGALLHSGDAVVLTKNLDVKGSNVNARLGTVIKNIRLVPDNTDQIEGKIDGQMIVILTKYVRRQS